jgi:hypothetical protein
MKTVTKIIYPALALFAFGYFAGSPTMQAVNPPPLNRARIVLIGRMTAASPNALAIETRVSYAPLGARLRSPTVKIIAASISFRMRWHSVG